MILDSNIIIYAGAPDGAALRAFIAERGPSVSVVSLVEFLGYHRLSTVEKTHFEAFFAAAEILPIDQPVLDRAVVLRQQRKMALGDALIAATALVHQRALVTHNTADFAWIRDLQLLDPLADGGRE